MVSLNHCYCNYTDMAFIKAVSVVHGHVNMQRQVLRLCNGRHRACAVNLGMSNGSFCEGVINLQMCNGRSSRVWDGHGDDGSRNDGHDGAWP